MADHAEVIGDPIGHSKSPLIHQHWLDGLGIAASYRATRVEGHALAGFLETRRGDSAWRGCNVTAPHKEAIMPLLDGVDPAAAAVGAVNCVVPRGGALTGYNSDVEGVEAAVGDAQLTGRRLVLIGTGGAARAALHALVRREPGEIVILGRTLASAKRLAKAAPGLARAGGLGDGAKALGGAGLIINATPMGMAHAAHMPDSILTAFSEAAAGALAFDMVYEPMRTPFLAAAEAAGLRGVDGLAMLIGQARRAFHLFFGAAAPQEEAQLRARLRASGLA